MVEFDQEELTFEPVIVPNDAISPIIKILDKQPDVKVELSDAKIRITAGATSLISKLVDGEYLPYEKLKPSATAIQLCFSAKALSDAVTRVLTVSTDAMSGIAFGFADGGCRSCPVTPTTASPKTRLPLSAMAPYKPASTARIFSWRWRIWKRMRPSSP
ncbi:hypothetical protein LP421_17015 [Rhizobium sp. RCAM05350]|nr:hypothetical protein LP421_17015 [Rhizobium sp. RCAM05350]